jgi:hypothetical protein
MTATALANLSGPELRALGEAADLRDLRRQHNFEALLRAPTLGAFAPGAAPLPPTSPEELGSAMSALALRCWSVGGIVRAAEGFSAGRLFPEVVDRVVVDVLARRTRGQL